MKTQLFLCLSTAAVVVVVAISPHQSKRIKKTLLRIYQRLSRMISQCFCIFFCKHLFPWQIFVLYTFATCFFLLEFWLLLILLLLFLLLLLVLFCMLSQKENIVATTIQMYMLIKLTTSLLYIVKIHSFIYSFIQNFASWNFDFLYLYLG